MEQATNKLEGIWIEIKILKNEELTLQEKVLLAMIKALDNEKGCFASNKYFAELLGVSVRRVQEILSSLGEKEYITVEIKGYNTRTIRINNKEEEQAGSQKAVTLENGIELSGENMMFTLKNNEKKDCRSKTKVSKFNNICTHNRDFDELERLEQQYILKQVATLEGENVITFRNT